MDILREMREWRVVSHRLRHWAEKKPDGRFIKCDSPWLTFADLETRTDRIAAGFQELGVAKGDRVAVILPNRLEMILTIFALAKIGAIQVPLNTFLKGEFLQYQVHDAAAEIVVGDAPALKELSKLTADLPHLKKVVGVGLTQDDAKSIAPWLSTVETFAFEDLESSVGVFREVDLAMEDLIAIMYTSGTTGLPKGCMLSNGYYTAIPWLFYENGFVTQEDSVFTAMPLFHLGSGGIYMMEALQGGLPITFEPAFSARSFMARAAEEKATLAHCVGAMGAAILATPESDQDQCHDLRHVMIMPMSFEDQKRFKDRFGATVFSLGYGQTEVSPTTFGTPEMQLSKAETLGYPSRFLDVTVRDEQNNETPIGQVGEICVRPKEPEVMFQGYWRKPDATEAAYKEGWFHSGDLGVMDEDRYITFRGRKSDSMRRRGENVSAIELENAIVQHPKIASAAAFAVKSELSEDDIKVCLVTNNEDSIEPAELFEFFKGALPYFAVPRYVEFMDELPLTATGRVMKHRLRGRPNTDVIDFDELGLQIGREDRR